MFGHFHCDWHDCCLLNAHCVIVLWQTNLTCAFQLSANLVPAVNVIKEHPQKTYILILSLHSECFLFHSHSFPEWVVFVRRICVRSSLIIKTKTKWKRRTNEIKKTQRIKNPWCIHTHRENTLLLSHNHFAWWLFPILFASLSVIFFSRQCNIHSFIHFVDYYHTEA